MNRATEMDVANVQLPALSELERTERDLEGDLQQTCLNMLGSLPRDRGQYAGNWPVEQNEASVLKVEQFIMTDQFRAFHDRVKRLWRPATKSDIAKHLAILIGSFPGKPSNPSVFGRILCEDVGALSPSVLALDITCRQLRRTATFLPTIAEIIPVLTRNELMVKHRTHYVLALPEAVERAHAFVESQRLAPKHTEAPDIAASGVSDLLCDDEPFE